MFTVRLRTRNSPKEYAGKKDLLVNIGAGDSGKEGWVNLDGFPGNGVTCLADARKRLSFEDDSVRGIFSEHFFEHIDYCEEAPHFLRECFRSLQPGGVLRIIVPDLERYLRAYAEDDWNAFAKIRPLDKQLKDHHYGWQYNTQMELINLCFDRDSSTSSHTTLPPWNSLLKNVALQRSANWNTASPKCQSCASTT
jgi:predicted SAM-dependent methyltransferase